MSPSPGYRAFIHPGLLLCVLSLLATCKKPDDGSGNSASGQREPDTTQTNGPPDRADAGGTSSQQGGQWYRAWFVDSEGGGQIPFFLQLPARPHRGTALIAHGEHRVEAEARWYGSEASVNLPLFRTRLFLRQDASGKLVGHLTSRSPALTGTISHPVQAIPVPEPDDSTRFPDPASCGASADASTPAPPLPLGTWQASFGEMGEGELLIEQRAPKVVAGTFTFRDSGVTTAIGNVFGNRICLSRFDGANPFLAIIDIEPDGKGITGRWVTGGALDKRVSFAAEKGDQVTRVADGIDFVSNKTKLSLFELGLPQFRGKPVMIDFAGTWCPPCIDAVPVMKELYQRHHGEGLEIVTLLFELVDDEETLRKQARLFVETYDIPWTVIPVRGEIKPYWDVVPHDAAASEVNLPVAIFVNADGTIRDAHMGFPNPASGQAYQAMVERYQRVARELVAKD